MKDFILPLPRLILPLKLAAFIITLAVLGVFSFTSFTEAETPDIGPYAALDSLLAAPVAASNCQWEICTYRNKCVGEIWSFTFCSFEGSRCRTFSC